MAEIRLFGIRHHGAGSCRNLVSALEIFLPDLLLVECPHDAESCLDFVALDLIEPPAAIMIYNPQNLNQYAYYPFTVFSPEWQAFQFGIRKSVPVRFFDLPQSQSFLISERTTVSRKEEGFTHDPFGHMAMIAGFDDPERWWEEYIEQQRDAPEIFDTILDLMIELRSSDISDKQSNLLREAFMRQQIREAEKDGFQKIAVVCGAWHTPALTDPGTPTKSEDQKMLRGLKKTTAVYTWVPWSYSRISRHTGYSSGVISPFWYEALFTDPDTAVARWMSRASKILGDLGHPVSPAHTIESSRLAEQLAYLRKKSMPGLSELFDAVTTVQARGNEEILNQLKVRLLEGEKTGQVSEQVPTVPLLRDLEDHLKQVKLKRDWKKEGLIEKHFDLRKPIHLQASRLLHRLNLLGIDWGVQKDPEHNPLGTFHEYWDLEWFPEFEIQIIEASMWGNTVEEAAVHYISDQLQSEASFDFLGQLLYLALHAHIPQLVDPISRKIRDLGNLTEDVLALMRVIPPLIWSLRYGDTTQIDTKGITHLINQLYPRLCILLPGKITDLSEEIAQETFHAQNNFHQAIQLLDHHTYLETWEKTLFEIADKTQANAMIKGNCVRLLIIRQAIREEQLFVLVRFNLTTLSDPFYPCYFLEGLLFGGGWLIIHKKTLRQIIDQWILTLDEETFLNYLPILRRTFSTFSVEEKEAIYDLLFSGKFVNEDIAMINEKRKHIILQGVQKILQVK
ncbi:MAG: hypothetical protein KDC80_19045 [Saprospiraceae bacterium]|nr:hypothetical protein [Saprospiraceae bacterium]